MKVAQFLAIWPSVYLQSKNRCEFTQLPEEVIAEYKMPVPDPKPNQMTGVQPQLLKGVKTAEQSVQTGEDEDGGGFGR